MGSASISPIPLVLWDADRGALQRPALRRKTAQALPRRAHTVVTCAGPSERAHVELARELAVHRSTIRT